MPVYCSHPVQPLTTDEFRELDYRVMYHAYETQNDLGRLADERIYQSALADRLRKDGFSIIRELKIELSYQNFLKNLFVDLIANECGVYELKAVSAITSAHLGQLLTYLQLLDLPRGKLINFGGPKVEGRFVNAPLTTEERRAFALDDSDYTGSHEFKTFVIGLLGDWGTSLSLSLYEEAIIDYLGGLELVEQMVPLIRDGIALGNQRFRLASPDTAFCVTAMNEDLSAYESQLGRLFRYSPLRAMYWVNIRVRQVTLKTLVR